MGAFLAAAAPLAGNIISGFLNRGAAKKASQAQIDAAEAAKRRVLEAAGTSEADVTAAGQRAPQLVNEAVGAGNRTLSDALGRISDTTSPYLQGGATGTGAITDFVNKGLPQFNFNLADWQNDPGFKFQMEQGTNAIGNLASARGAAQSGNVLKDLTTFGQGLANTYYSDAFNRALKTFGTNRESELARIGAAEGLAGRGLGAAGLQTGAEQNIAGQQARNTVGAGYYAGDTGLSVADFLANLRKSAATEAGGLDIRGGEARAGGILGQNNATTGMISGAVNTLPGLLKSFGLRIQ
jgi:hypothetical protein